jgi:hypothetical protein
LGVVEGIVKVWELEWRNAIEERCEGQAMHLSSHLSSHFGIIIIVVGTRPWKFGIACSMPQVPSRDGA